MFLRQYPKVGVHEKRKLHMEGRQVFPFVLSQKESDAGY